MSTGDPFATTGDDPFADPAPAPTEAAPVQSTQEATPTAPQEPVAPPEPTPDVPTAPAAPEPTAADLEPQTPPEPGEPPVVNREGEPVAPSEPPQAPAAPPEAPEPTTTPTPATPDASANGTPPADPADDPNAPKKGFRHYVVLYQTGPGQFTVAPLKDKHGKEGMDFIRRLTEPAEKEGEADVVNFYLEARNNDHAYRLCFTLFNRPADGVTVLPLPKASWRPRRVAPAPPAPERERLSIS